MSDMHGTDDARRSGAADGACACTETTAIVCSAHSDSQCDDTEPLCSSLTSVRPESDRHCAGSGALPQRGAGQRPAKNCFAKAHDSSKIQLGAMSN